MNKSKWEILMSRAERLEEDAAKIREELRQLTNTPFGERCTGCQSMLYTEADFARHFLVNDPRYLNLGRCPVKSGERNIDGSPKT